jgi:tRNA nucleotidyltransferase (CCA-adding enzyme)
VQIYVVGGAVRDQLLGRPVVDRDYVVVGATPEEMLAQGYLPVGRDFPVFLHPTTREEYALARTERKTAPGYAGFVFHTDAKVTLEEDLKRRDLTINAMAQTLDGTTLIDPCHGAKDLKERWFRHVGPAFVEDPVRLLRVARFAARFTEFRLAPETKALLVAMVDNKEVDALVPERVWAEMSRGLMEEAPSRMIEILDAVGARARIAPLAPASRAALDALDRAARSHAPLAARFAVWLVAGGLGASQIATLCGDLKTPIEMREYSVQLQGLEAAYQSNQEPRAAQLLSILEASDALRRPERFAVLLAALADLVGGDHPSGSVGRFAERLGQSLETIRLVDNRQVAASAKGQDVAAAIHAARLAALEDSMGQPAQGH